MTDSSLTLSSSQQGKAMIDSLPYVEEIHQDYEDYALVLIEDEMKEMKEQTPSLQQRKMPALRFRTPMMKNEYTERRQENGEFRPREETSNSYQPSKIVRPESLAEWKTIAIPQAKARFEAERIRGLILSAEKEEAVLAWKDYNSKVLEQMKAQLSKILKEQEEEVEEVNFQRQQAQQNQYGPQLEQLNTDYQQMLYRRNQLEHSIEGLRRAGALSGKRKISSTA